jgi:hypothetical protein
MIPTYWSRPSRRIKPCWDARRVWQRRMPHSIPPRMKPPQRRRVSSVFAFPIARPKAPNASASRESAGSATVRNGARDARDASAWSSAATASPVAAGFDFPGLAALCIAPRNAPPPDVPAGAAPHLIGQERARRTALSSPPRTSSPQGSSTTFISSAPRIVRPGQRQWWQRIPSAEGAPASSPRSLLSPASAVVPPRGCGGGGAMVCRDPERRHSMAKPKSQASAKPRSGTKTRSKVKRAGGIVTKHKGSRLPAPKGCFVADHSKFHSWFNTALAILALIGTSVIAYNGGNLYSLNLEAIGFTPRFTYDCGISVGMTMAPGQTSHNTTLDFVGMSLLPIRATAAFLLSAIAPLNLPPAANVCNRAGDTHAPEMMC